jgi:hypothetical protein
MSGAPLVRPLWWPSQGGAADSGEGPSGDDEGRGVDDAFLLGDALLVAPVCSPGARARAVPVAEGSWTSFWGDEQDPATGVDLPAPGRPGSSPPGALRPWPAPLARLPVLVRAGVVIPLDDGWAQPGGPVAVDGDTAAATATTGAFVTRLPLDHAPILLAFHCWPDADGAAEGVCVDDAGDGDGPVRRDVLRVVGARPGSTARCSWERRGDFPAPARVRVVVHGMTAERATVDGVEVLPSGTAVDCGPFSELILEGLRPIERHHT